MWESRVGNGSRGLAPDGVRSLAVLASVLILVSEARRSEGR